MDQQQAKFEGWAVIEIFGHSKAAGFVTTEYFGGPALFRVDAPELPEREIVTTRPQYEGYKLIPAGAKIRKEAIAGRTEYVGPSAIFRLHPCTEEVVRKTLEEMAPRPITVLGMPAERALLPGEEERDDRAEMEPTDEELEAEEL